ncbi:MAG TPA: hypothetical protein VFI97_03765 [Arthrobacter sp.]|nr:hypothetical protein [Arthrobacter sp.]
MAGTAEETRFASDLFGQGGQQGVPLHEKAEMRECSSPANVSGTTIRKIKRNEPQVPRPNGDEIIVPPPDPLATVSA